MAADLPWALENHELLRQHCRDVRDLAGDLDPVLLDLTGDVRTATRRALDQRGEKWAKRHARMAVDAGHVTGGIEDRITALVREQFGVLREAELAAMRAAGWPIVELDATRSAAEVLEQAWSALGLSSKPAPSEPPAAP